MKQFLIPESIPLIVYVCYMAHLFSGVDLKWWHTLGMVLVTVVIPAGLGIWYGWSLKRGMINT